MKHFSTGIFAELNAKKDELEGQGKHLYNLFVGTPDFEPAPHIMKAVTESAARPEDYKSDNVLYILYCRFWHRRQQR